MKDKIIIQVVMEAKSQKLRIDKDDKMSWFEVLGVLHTMVRVINDKLHTQQQPPVIIDKLPGKVN